MDRPQFWEWIVGAHSTILDWIRAQAKRKPVTLRNPKIRITTNWDEITPASDNFEKAFLYGKSAADLD